ncbi:MAG: sugar phosphate isomerase/epimerase family protein [Phycisphaerae bacterium]|jgi:sugar phosphate isomerase/epimerase
MMKLGFSARVCPEWDLTTLIGKAAELGFNGVELVDLRGGPPLPSARELTANPDVGHALLESKKVELACLSSDVTLDSKNNTELNKQRTALAETVGLAAKLRCPFVRISAGHVQRLDTERFALARIADALRALVPMLSRHDVTLLVENGGDFTGANHLWHLVDAVDHPTVRGCWNQCQAMTSGERATRSIPRLGSRLGLVHLCDAAFDENHVLTEYKLLGDGNTDVAHQIDLLKGIVYDRYLIFDWPKNRIPSLPDPDDAVPKSYEFMRECVEAKQTVLAAYKGDKQAPRMAARTGATATV